MKVIESGHVYELDDLKSSTKTRFQFHMDPAIHGKALDGPSSQEVLRMVIQRVKHLNAEQEWEGNDEILFHLRSAITLFECRAMMKKAEGSFPIEDAPLDQDGHIKLSQ